MALALSLYSCGTEDDDDVTVTSFSSDARAGGVVTELTLPDCNESLRGDIKRVNELHYICNGSEWKVITGGDTSGSDDV